MRELLDRARLMTGVEQVLMSVTTTQRSVKALYESLGFEVSGVDPRAFRIGERYVDQLHMMLRL